MPGWLAKLHPSWRQKLSAGFGALVAFGLFIADKLDWLRKLIESPTTFGSALEIVGDMITSTTPMAWIILAVALLCLAVATVDLWRPLFGGSDGPYSGWERRDRSEVHVLACLAAGVEPTYDCDKQPQNQWLRRLQDAIHDKKLRVILGDIDGHGPQDGKMVQISRDDFAEFATNDGDERFLAIVTKWVGPKGSASATRPTTRQNRYSREAAIDLRKCVKDLEAVGFGHYEGSSEQAIKRFQSVSRDFMRDDLLQPLISQVFVSAIRLHSIQTTKFPDGEQPDPNLVEELQRELLSSSQRVLDETAAAAIYNGQS